MPNSDCHGATCLSILGMVRKLFLASLFRSTIVIYSCGGNHHATALRRTLHSPQSGKEVLFRSTNRVRVDATFPVTRSPSSSLPSPSSPSSQSQSQSASSSSSLALSSPSSIAIGSSKQTNDNNQESDVAEVNDRRRGLQQQERPIEATTRIDNGENALPHKYRFFTQMWGKGNELGCGASLIASKWLLTAAHCIEPRLERIETENYPSWKVGYFCRDKKNCRTPFHKTASKRGHVHPHYNGTVPRWDFGLVELMEPVPSSITEPVPIDDGFISKNLIKGEALRGVGTGEVNDDGDVPFFVQEVENYYLPLEDCRWAYSTGDQFDDSILCTNGKNHGFCFGDSGGPVLVPDASSWSGYRQVGVHSFGSPFCENHDYPDGAARVGSAYHWIRSTVCPSYASDDAASRPHFCDGIGMEAPSAHVPAPNPTLEPTPRPSLPPSQAPTQPPAGAPNLPSSPLDGPEGAPNGRPSNMEGTAGNNADPSETEGGADDGDNDENDKDSPESCKEKSSWRFYDKKKEKFRKCSHLKRQKNREKYCTKRTTASTACPVSCRICTKRRRVVSRT